jgi:glycosyltransferase involved in cell wall biosynthesis
MRALKNGATPRARLLVINNAPLEQCEEGICVEGPTGGFIEELSKLLPGIEVAQGLVRFDSTVAPNPFDLSSCPGLRLAGLPWRQETRIGRILSYLRSLPWVIQRVRGARALYVYLPGHLPLIFAITARLLGRPYGCYLRGEINEPWRSWGLNGARFILVANEGVQRLAQRHCANTTLISPLVDLTESDISPPKQPRSQPPWRLLYVGRIEAVKGIRELLRAAGLARASGVNLELDLVGSNLEPAHYRREAERAGLKAVRFHGVISDRDRLRDLFNAADLFVLPTHSEGFPRVLLEAMAFGIPVLTTFVGGIPSLMDDGVNCLRIPVRDAEGLARVMERALLDSELRFRIAAGGNESVRRILSSERPSHAQRVAEELIEQERAASSR